MGHTDSFKEETMFTAFLQWVLVAGFVGVIGIAFSQGREMQYNDYKDYKDEPRPVYPPLKKKPYTRSTRLA